MEDYSVCVLGAGRERLRLRAGVETGRDVCEVGGEGGGPLAVPDWVTRLPWRGEAAQLVMNVGSTAGE